MESNKKRILVKRIIMIGGIICIAFGIFHLFILPSQGKWELHVQNLPKEFVGTIYTLNNGIGLIFLCFGIISIVFGKSFLRGSFEAWNFSFLIGLVFVYRAIAQFFHYGTSGRDFVLFFISLAIGLLYIIPLLLFYKEFKPPPEG